MFYWASLQINRNSVSSPHVDRNNEGPSIVMLFGDFEGGAFSMSDGSHSIRKPGNALVIDGTKMHYSEEFTGMRFSVVAFLHNSTKEMSVRDRHKLIELGFVFPNKGPDASPSIRPPNQLFPPPTHHSMFVEFCCEPDSMLGQRSPKDCRVVRLTEADDMASARGATIALNTVSQAPAGRLSSFAASQTACWDNEVPRTAALSD